VDQCGQVIDVLLSEQRDTAAARRFFIRALRHGPVPVEVIPDKVGPYLGVLDELVSTASHITEQYASNRMEADHGRLKVRLRPMRGLNSSGRPHDSPPAMRSCRTFRRGHYELATDVPPPLWSHGQGNIVVARWMLEKRR
jgi:transposase-like protein